MAPNGRHQEAAAEGEQREDIAASPAGRQSKRTAASMIAGGDP